MKNHRLPFVGDGETLRTFRLFGVRFGAFGALVAGCSAVPLVYDIERKQVRAPFRENDVEEASRGQAKDGSLQGTANSNGIGRDVRVRDLHALDVGPHIQTELRPPTGNALRVERGILRVKYVQEAVHGEHHENGLLRESGAWRLLAVFRSASFRLLALRLILRRLREQGVCGF
eukprot:scaffold7329_cov222-Pinguiococcus_pyrenoidosus.AAC.9